MEDSEDAHIETCHNCGVNMDVTTIEPFRRVQCVECENEQRVKRDFGNYYLQRRHAYGGMSIVFLAEDKNLGREVALKVLNDEYSKQEKRIAAFEKEAELTALVTHPHVVKVYTVGRAWGHFYLSMEMLQGQSLEHLMKQGALEEEMLLPLMLQVVSGLRAAYETGLIHRDMKPGNILVTDEHSDAGTGQAKIVDFGLALMTYAGEVKAEEIWATPYYVSPETLDGNSENFRSDIYALGATIYHALYGNPPFEVDGSTATKVLREAKNHIKPLSQVTDEVSAPTCQVVEKMMSVCEDERHSSYDELEADLKWALQSLTEEGLARPESELSRQRAQRRTNQKQFQWGITGGVFALIAILGAFYFSRVNDSSSGEEVANVQPPHPPENGGNLPDKEAQANQEAASKVHRHYQEARKAVERRDFSDAISHFDKIAGVKRAKDPTVSWAKFEAAMMHYFLGQPYKAETRLKNLHADFDQMNTEQRQLAPNQLIQASRELLSANLKSHQALELDSEDSLSQMLPFIFGLQNWESANGREAVKWFSSFKEIPPEHDWIHSYQTIAQQFIHDHQLIHETMLGDTPKEATALLEMSNRLESTLPQLKTKGRAPNSVRRRLADLAVFYQLAMEQEKKEQKESRQFEKKAFEDLLIESFELAKGYEFGRALELLESVESITALNRNQKDAVNLILSGSNQFVDNLATHLSPGFLSLQVKEREGQFSAQSLTAVREDGLELVHDSEKRFLEWKEIQVDSLIGLHLALEQEEKDDSARDEMRKWLICFSWMENLRAKADEAAQKLGEKNTTFKKEWALLKHLNEWRK